ncbi:hypothetical protein B0H19DRAFT_1180675 [Mycena capillaripes]|nr:hypothetical protein B0H19DRAFT_1180675 [Mycena capillaripes]
MILPSLGLLLSTLPGSTVSVCGLAVPSSYPFACPTPPHSRVTRRALSIPVHRTPADISADAEGVLGYWKTVMDVAATTAKRRNPGVTRFFPSLGHPPPRPTSRVSSSRSPS